MAKTYTWWQTGIIYQIYPHSFQDSNNDGVGDLPGIISKLDYLSWLGVDAIWLSPIYPSPMADFGYDISNYTDIHPLFGTLEDLDTFVQEAHKRDLKIIMDYVPNHTSDEHPWFQQSRSSLTNEKRDWYIWRDPAPDGGPPNNWISPFGGPAWQFDEQTGQYYLHMFDVKQPDLNWRNPAVREAMYDVLHFWLDRGIDGFRIDVLSRLVKDEHFRDNPPNPEWKPGDHPIDYQLSLYNKDLPGMHAIVREMRAIIDSYEQRMLIGELYMPLPRLVQYYGEQLDEIHLPFNFQLVTMRHWEASAIREIIEAYEAILPGEAWPNWVLSNHDRPRIAKRVGRAQAPLAQLLLLTLRGTPTCYYGDELGMQDFPIPREFIHDPQGKDNPELSRDMQRTPMQWNSGPNAGFTAPEVTSWLPIADDYQTYNVEVERQNPHALLMLTRTLMHLRRSLPALNRGSYQAVEQKNADCLAYLRQHDDQRYLVLLNFSAQEQVVHLPIGEHGSITLSTRVDREGSIDLSTVHLRSNEGLLIDVS
ncbi:alpha-amylase [Dictyobacter sp. S3.2.2.5]|uniref:Alpha-amylase n=1 Tax=Dictyobacter halimunensis TaxID=3026934 RepID=A0ABQ6FNM0_9CHLR|nr:alpha-amylase [Dictyobacter sp. S3.2.2.5]